MNGYYSDRLSAERLRACYEIAPPAVRDYLEAEIAFVSERIRRSDRVLELGCGYGRVLKRLAAKAGRAFGIDTSAASLRMAAGFLAGEPSVCLAAMDASHLSFRNGVFDATLCVQNGISAFHADPSELLSEALRVTRPAGIVLFSSYAARFWHERLAWFRLQAAAGLIGEIDEEATDHGVIVCKDGFRATTVDDGGFRAFAAVLGVRPRLTEVAGSSLFCEIMVPSKEPVGDSG
jgi:2-polyprenyl-6-hydroxyphenyl methylase/3-demethylubiquinone-9 3-methyltransferase